MKKLTIFAVVCMMTITAFAQNMNVQTAFNYLKKDKFDKALEYIEPALTNAQTMSSAKTWFYYGRICLGIAISQDPAVQSLVENPLDKALEAFTQALELDKREDFKQEIYMNIASISDAYYTKGVEAYNKNSKEGFLEAAQNFNKVYTVKATLGQPDFDALSNAGLCLMRVEEFQGAAQVYEQLRAAGFNKADVYSNLSTAYLSLNDAAKAEEILKEGVLKFPQDQSLMIASINLYLKQNKPDDAIAVIDKAITLDPQNHTLYFAKGDCYSKEGKIEEAKQAYEQALAVKPDYLDAMYNLGALYINAAAPKIEEANNLPITEQEKYDQLLKEADALIQQALPHMEKAHQMDPNDQVIKNSLKEIYVRLKMNDKLDALNKE
ncbi:MAG: tetratricopeptide repeat protein [Bacteroidales bacterium]|nr:tetratricopeptide repeat protein [Bacteroidales bacterium]